MLVKTSNYRINVSDELYKMYIDSQVVPFDENASDLLLRAYFCNEIPMICENYTQEELTEAMETMMFFDTFPLRKERKDNEHLRPYKFKHIKIGDTIYRTFKTKFYEVNIPEGLCQKYEHHMGFPFTDQAVNYCISSVYAPESICNICKKYTIEEIENAITMFIKDWCI